MKYFPCLAMISLMTASAVALGCSTRVHAIRTTPERVAPQVSLEPGEPQQGEGRVTIDVVDGPADVGLVRAQSTGVAWSTYSTAVSFGENVMPVCTSPCVANLPYGNYRIKTSVLSDSSIGDSAGVLVVGQNPSVWRRAPTITKSRPGLYWGGFIMVTTGLALGPMLLGFGAADYGATGGLLGTGAVFTAMGLAGIPMMLKGRTEQWPGAQVQW